MLRAAPPRVLQAFASLDTNTDFDVVRIWMESELKTLTNTLYVSKPEQTGPLQGACQVIDDYLRLATTARDVINSKRG